jgi:hypothetical protein
MNLVNSTKYILQKFATGPMKPAVYQFIVDNFKFMNKPDKRKILKHITSNPNDHYAFLTYSRTMNDELTKQLKTFNNNDQSKL